MTSTLDMGDINNHLLEFERSLQRDSTTKNPTLATSVMVMMVKGLFSPLCYPYVHFPCASFSGDLLFDPFWEAIYRLERMEFKVRYTVLKNNILCYNYNRCLLLPLTELQLIIALLPFTTRKIKCCTK